LRQWAILLDEQGVLSYNLTSVPLQSGDKETAVLATLITALQIITALAVVILMAVQTSKAEQGGVMGLGAAGGRGAGEIDMLVGAERILKPLTRWMAIGFLFSSLLAAIPNATIVHFAVILALYLVIMLYGNLIWAALTGRRS
jgi:preprotein translocase subunit SecG